MLMERLGKAMIFLGIFIVVAGVVIWLFGDKLRFIGRLPGDIRIEKENFRLYIPITTMILLSVILTVLVWIFQRFKS
jgi:hypothetical protein